MENLIPKVSKNPNPKVGSVVYSAEDIEDIVSWVKTNKTMFLKLAKKHCKNIHQYEIHRSLEAWNL